MIRFLRKIRQELVTKNKISKYLLYAVGEILLVVIGILLALQIDTWNTEYQNRKQEHEILEQLREEYLSNRDQIEQKVKIRNLMKQSHLKLLSYRGDPIISEDSVNFHLIRTIVWPTFDPDLGITNELIASGKLYLIRNGELRKQLTTWLKYVDELKEEEVILMKWVTEDYYRFLRENYQLGKMHQLIDPEMSDLYALSETTYLDSLSLTPGDPLALLENPNFEDLLVQILWHVQHTNIQSEGVKQALDNILELVETELHPGVSTHDSINIVD
jgi:hypothetical protein